MIQLQIIFHIYIYIHFHLDYHLIRYTKSLTQLLPNLFPATARLLALEWQRQVLGSHHVGARDETLPGEGSDLEGKLDLNGTNYGLYMGMGQNLLIM